MTASYHHPSTSSSLLLDVLLLKSSLHRQRFRRPPSDKLSSFLLTTPSSDSFVKKHGLSSVVAKTQHNMDNAISLDQNPAQGKRQRRQAAATLVQNFPSWTGVGKKSKAQPRPQVQIPPRGIGPVADPNQNDVLCGRGGRYVDLVTRRLTFVCLFGCLFMLGSSVPHTPTASTSSLQNQLSRRKRSVP